MHSNYDTVRTQSATVFAAAMPPLLSSYAPFAPAQTTSLGLRSGLLSFPSQRSCSTQWLSLGACPATRREEASLCRREIELRAEFQRLCAEEKTRARCDEERRRHEEDAEERRRLLAMAQEVEEARARRLEEQQSRLLEKEKELESWKLERAKEASEAHSRRVEEDDRRRELQYQRELQRLKEQAEVRVEATRHDSVILQETLRESQRALFDKLQQELAAKEDAHQKAAERREEEWTRRVEAMEVARATELAHVHHQLSQDQERAVRSERQLTEARDQLSALIREIESLKMARSSGAESAASAAEVHRTAISRLQQMYDDDKRETQRAFLVERDRMKHEQDRRLEELKDHHASQLRAKMEEIDSLERRLAQATRDVQEEKARATLANPLSNDPYGLQEITRTKDELRSAKLTIQELEEQRKRLERRLNESEERADAQASTLQILQADTIQRRKQEDDEMEHLRQENMQVKRSLSEAHDRHEAELAKARKQIKEAEAAALNQVARDADATHRKINERLDDERRQWDAERSELRARLRASEESQSAVRLDLETAQRELATLRADVASRSQELENRANQMRGLQNEVESRVHTEMELKDARARLQRLQEDLVLEREQRQRQHEAALEVKERELQQMRSHGLEATKMINDLREEVSNSKYGLDEGHQRLKRELGEREQQIAQLRRELEGSHQAEAQWKVSYEDVVAQKERGAESFQKMLQQREEDMRVLNARLDKEMEEKYRLQQILRAEQAKDITTANRDSEVQRILREHGEAADRLNQEVTALRHQLQVQKQIEEELRHHWAMQAPATAPPIPAAIPSAVPSIPAVSPQPSVAVPVPARVSPLTPSLLNAVASPAKTSVKTPSPVAVHSLSVGGQPTTGPQPSAAAVPSVPVPSGSSWLAPPSFSRPPAAASVVPSTGVPAPVHSAVPTPMPPSVKVPVPAGHDALRPSSSSSVTPPLLQHNTLEYSLTIPVPTSSTSSFQVAKSGTPGCSPIAVSIPAPAGSVSHSGLTPYGPVPVPTARSPPVAIPQQAAVHPGSSTVVGFAGASLSAAARPPAVPVPTGRSSSSESPPRAASPSTVAFPVPMPAATSSLGPRASTSLSHPLHVPVPVGSKMVIPVPQPR